MLTILFLVDYVSVSDHVVAAKSSRDRTHVVMETLLINVNRTR